MSDECRERDNRESPDIESRASSLEDLPYVIFLRESIVARGTLLEIIPSAKHAFDKDPSTPLVIFNNQTGRFIDLDLNGSESAVTQRYRSQTSFDARRQGHGATKSSALGKEVTLLPRHWDWLSEQPGGASVALRKLVDQARKASVEVDQTRRAREASHRFMTAMAGDKPGFEEADRALFAGDLQRFKLEIARWPEDIRRHLEQISAAGFSSTSGSAAFRSMTHD